MYKSKSSSSKPDCREKLPHKQRSVQIRYNSSVFKSGIKHKTKDIS